MSERWGDSQRDRNDLDRWLTTAPEDAECPECGAPLDEDEHCTECDWFAQTEPDWDSKPGGADYVP